MKIIHIVENLDKGAVENWLVNIFLESRQYRPEWNWTFYCILGLPGRRDEEVLAAGGQIVYSPVTVSDKYSFLKSLRKVLRDGHFDVIHSHHDYLSGFYLLSSIGLNFRSRILHVHNNDRGLPISNRLLHEVSCRFFGFAAMSLSDVVVGISKYTLDCFVEGKYPQVNDKRVLYYGVDFDRLLYCPGLDLRNELGLGPEAKILLFVGRLNEDKNPFFCLKILEELRKEDPLVFLVVVGDGGERQRMELYASVNELDNSLFFLGWRQDVKRIMWQANVFLFPRTEDVMEGLGLVVVEAQGAGLPMVLSRGIVDDAIVVGELSHRLALGDGVVAWAHKVRELLKSGTVIERTIANSRMAESKFSLRNGCYNLISLYEDATG